MALVCSSLHTSVASAQCLEWWRAQSFSGMKVWWIIVSVFSLQFYLQKSKSKRMKNRHHHFNARRQHMIHHSIWELSTPTNTNVLQRSLLTVASCTVNHFNIYCQAEINLIYLNTHLYSMLYKWFYIAFFIHQMLDSPVLSASSQTEECSHPVSMAA